MSIESTLNAVGFSDSARNYKQHAVVVGLRTNDSEGAPAQRKLGIQFITNDDPVTPEDLPLVPAVTIDEHSTKYEVVEEGHYKVTLDNPMNQWGRSIGGCNLWYYQGSEHHTETPPFTLPHYPFQKELRSSEVEGRYSPNKAKYFDFRQDYSAIHPKPLLNQFDLSSKLIEVTRYNYEPILMGNDFRQFGVVYIEFRNELDQPVVNPLFAGIETPSRFGHYILFDTTRSRAHIESDIKAQTRKIHPDIEFNISDYEGPPYRRMTLTLPLGWHFNRPQFYIDGYGLNEGSNQEQGAPSADGTMRLYQEEILQFNAGQGVYGVQLGPDGLSLEYSQDPAVPFPFPAQYLYPTTADALTIPWTPVDFETSKKYTVDVTIPTTAYTYDQNRPWQVFAKLGVTPEAGEIGLSSAVWVIEGAEGEPDVELPAYFIRYVTGTMPPEDGGGFGPIGGGTPTQTTAVFKCPEGMTYLEREILKNSVAVADGVGAIEMRIAPPPIDGYGISPFIGIKPVEAKLRLTFERPDIDDTFKFFTGSSSELQEALAMTPQIPKGMFVPPDQDIFTFSNPEGTEVGDPEYKIMVESNLGFNWSSIYSKGGVLIGKTIVEELMDYLGNPAYVADIGFDYDGRWQPVPEEQLLNYLRPDGSILLPIIMGQLSVEESVEGNFSAFVLHIEDTNIIDPHTVKHLEIEVNYDFLITGIYADNMNKTLPLVMNNVLQGRSPEEVFVEVMLRGVGEVNGVSRVSLDKADAVSGSVFGDEFNGLDFEVIFDAVADTLTVTKMGGPQGLLAVSSATTTTPYAPLTVPVDIVQRSVDYVDWVDSTTATATHPVTKHLIPLPFPEEGDLYLPEIAAAYTVEALPTALRDELAGQGFTFNSTETVAHNVVITEPLSEGLPHALTAQVQMAAPYVNMAAKAAAGYDTMDSNTYRFKRECVMIKITEHEVINAWQAKKDSLTPANLMTTVFIDAHYRASSGNLRMHSVMYGECRVVMEGEVECLYVPIPIYANLSMGVQGYTVMINLPPNGYQHYKPINLAVTTTFVEPTGLVALTKALEAEVIGIGSLWTAATSVTAQTLYDNPVYIESFSEAPPFSGSNESISWHSRPVIDGYGQADQVQIGDFNGSGAANAVIKAQGGLNRDTASIIAIVLEGVTIPPEFPTETGPFKILQVGSDVQIFTKFDVLTLPRTVYPFTQNTINYVDGFGGTSWNVRQTVAMDKTLLPAPVLASNPNIRVESQCKMSYGFTNASFYHNFNSATTMSTILSAPKSELPPTADLLYVKTKAEITVLYEGIYAYEGEVGPAPAQT